VKLTQVIALSCAFVPVAALVYWARGDVDAIRPYQGRWNLPLAERRHDPFPRVFVSVSGERVEVPAPPRKIVSGTIFSDAILLEICAPSRIVALHELSQDPRFSPVAAESASFPRHHRGEPEEILEMAPDMVIVSSFSREETRRMLARHGCAVLRFEGFTGIADIQSNIRALGYVLGLDQEAEALTCEMDARLAKVAAGGAKRRAWRLLHYEVGRTSGAQTTFDSLLSSVGARNAAAEAGVRGSQAMTIEQLLIEDPDALVMGVAPGKEDVARQRLLQTPGLTSLRAVRNDRLIFVPSGWLLSTSHHIVRAAEYIAAVLDRWGSP